MHIIAPFKRETRFKLSQHLVQFNDIVENHYFTISLVQLDDKSIVRVLVANGFQNFFHLMAKECCK